MRKLEDGSLEFLGEDEILIDGRWVKLKDLTWREIEEVEDAR